MRTLMLAVVLAGCRAATPQLVTAPPVAGLPGVAAPVVAAQPAPDPCAGRTDLIVTPRGTIAAQWNHSMTMGGKGTVEVRWCGAGSLAVYRLTIGSGRQTIYEFEPFRRLVTGQSVVLPVAGSAAPGVQPVEVFAIADDRSEVRGHAQVESVDDPVRAAAIAACRDCRGAWARRGLAGYESCDCPTTDAGRRCIAKADCQGPCLATGWEVVSEGPPCEPGQRRERLVGTCSATHTAFGCRATIDGPGAPACVSPGLSRRLPYVCRD